MGLILFSIGKNAAGTHTVELVICDDIVYIGGRSGLSTTEISCVLARA